MQNLFDWFSQLPIGTPIVAASDFGPIIRGQWGMVVGRDRPRRFSRRKSDYVCTFLGGIRVVARHDQIIPSDHGCSLAVLEDPLWFLHNCGAVSAQAPELRHPVSRHT